MVAIRDQPKPVPITSANYGRRSGLKILIKKSIFQAENDNSNEFSKTIPNSDGMLVRDNVITMMLQKGV